MISNIILNRLQKHWHGPAVSLVVGQKAVSIGQGDVAATITFKKPSIVRKLLFSPSLSFGEAYMKGDITVDGDIMKLFQGFAQSREIVPMSIRRIRRMIRYIPISLSGGVKNARHHYDLGNDFYGLWLDKSRTYTSAYFLNESDSLDTAQFQKNDLICKKIRLEPGMTMLDIGCGWGGALFHAAV